MQYMISNSGETDEILKLIRSLQNIGDSIISITGGLQSTLTKHAAKRVQRALRGECS